MELILIVLILFAKKQHKSGFSHFDGKAQKVVFFYNPWPDAHIHINGYPSGITGSGFLNFPEDCETISLENVCNGEVVFAENYKLFDSFVMVFLPEVRKTPLKRVLP